MAGLEGGDPTAERAVPLAHQGTDTLRSNVQLQREEREREKDREKERETRERQRETLTFKAPLLNHDMDQGHLKQATI